MVKEDTEGPKDRVKNMNRDDVIEEVSDAICHVKIDTRRAHEICRRLQLAIEKTNRELISIEVNFSIRKINISFEFQLTIG